MTYYEQAQAESIRDLKFVKDGCQMSFDGSLGNIKPARNLLIVRTITNHLGNLKLARRQIVKTNF
jgi:hypothetical protein